MQLSLVTMARGEGLKSLSLGVPPARQPQLVSAEGSGHHPNPAETKTMGTALGGLTRPHLWEMGALRTAAPLSTRSPNLGFPRAQGIPNMNRASGVPLTSGGGTREQPVP